MWSLYKGGELKRIKKILWMTLFCGFPCFLQAYPPDVLSPETAIALLRNKESLPDGRIILPDDRVFFHQSGKILLPAGQIVSIEDKSEINFEDSYPVKWTLVTHTFGGLPFNPQKELLMKRNPNWNIKKMDADFVRYIIEECPDLTLQLDENVDEEFVPITLDTWQFDKEEIINFLRDNIHGVRITIERNHYDEALEIWYRITSHPFQEMDPAGQPKIRHIRFYREDLIHQYREVYPKQGTIWPQKRFNYFNSYQLDRQVEGINWHACLPSSIREECPGDSIEHVPLDEINTPQLVLTDLRKICYFITPQTKVWNPETYFRDGNCHRWQVSDIFFFSEEDAFPKTIGEIPCFLKTIGNSSLMRCQRRYYFGINLKSLWPPNSLSVGTSAIYEIWAETTLEEEYRGEVGCKGFNFTLRLLE